MDANRTSNSNLKTMELNNFLITEEIEFSNLDHIQQIANITVSSGESKRSHSFNQAEIDKMPVLSSSVYGTKRKHFSEGYVFDKIKEDSKKNKIYPETISITESTHSEHVEIDAGEPPPVDESLFFENLEPLKNVEVDGINLMSLIWSVVNVSEMKLLIEMENGNVPERDGILFPDSDKIFISKAFSWACFRGLSHLLPKLEESGANIHNTEFNGTNPVMIAAFSGHISCLEYLIERNVNLNYVNIFDGQSCLHSAALGNSAEAAKFVLDHGANLHLQEISETKPLLHYAIKVESESVVEVFLERGANPIQKNRFQQTPLHMACCVQSLHCCKLLLQKPEVDVNAVDLINQTPLYYAMMTTCSTKSVKIIELLLKHGALINLIDKSGFSPLHIAALNELSECVETLIWNGADISTLTSKGVSALNIILRKIPESFEMFQIKLDSSIRLKRPSCQNREFEMRMNFNPLLPSDDKPETSIINALILENRRNLLSHPLIKAFLHLKWEKIKRIYFLCIFMYAMMVISMTAYVLTALAYKCYNSFDSNNSGNMYSICFYFSKRIIEFEWYTWLIFTCVVMPRKILSFAIYKCIYKCFWNIESILDAVVLVSLFAISFIYTGKTYDWQKYIGAFAILCAWTNLMLMIGELPRFGTYVAMFTHIQFEFVKLLLAYSGLLIGFTVSFCIIFAETSAFDNPFTGLIKILVMMAGELDFEGLTNQSNSNVDKYPFFICARILFTLFVIFIVVIMMNLLIGIAVHDIQGLQKYADITKLVRQTKLIVYIEMVQRKLKVPFFCKKWILDHRLDVLSRKHILVVKPLNPMEKRLPEDILKAAFTIAQKNSPILDDEDFIKQVSWEQQKTEDNTLSSLQLAVETFGVQLKNNANEIHDVMDQLRDIKQLLQSIMLKLA